MLGGKILEVISLELEFETRRDDDSIVRFKLRDSIINYKTIRENVSESFCAESIEKIKKESGKKIAVLLGNCNMQVMQTLLLRNTQFRREYILIKFPADYEYDTQTFDLIFKGTGQIFSVCDLLLIQRCNFRNAKRVFISNENIAKKFKEKNSNLDIVWIPRTVFYGYFPQYFWNNPRNRKPDLFEHGDKYIFDIMETAPMNPDIETILDLLCAENFLTQEEISCNFAESIDQLYFQERNCDVKFAEYIEVNCKDQQIYYSPGHPHQLIMLEFTKRVLRYIGIRSDNFLRMSNFLTEPNQEISVVGRDVPIYPCVLKFFDFQEHLETYWANRNKWDFHANFRDFQREYILKCWAEKFTNQS